MGTGRLGDSTSITGSGSGRQGARQGPHIKPLPAAPQSVLMELRASGKWGARWTKALSTPIRSSPGLPVDVAYKGKGAVEAHCAHHEEERKGDICHV